MLKAKAHLLAARIVSLLVTIIVSLFDFRSFYFANIVGIVFIIINSSLIIYLFHGRFAWRVVSIIQGIILVAILLLVAGDVRECGLISKQHCPGVWHRAFGE